VRIVIVKKSTCQVGLFDKFRANGSVTNCLLAYNLIRPTFPAAATGDD